MANTAGDQTLSVTDDLLAINAEVCRELWRLADRQGGTVGALTPKPILPYRDATDIRVSEQEARFVYASVLGRASRYFFSVETPTDGKYSFTPGVVSQRRALSDLSLYTFNGQFEKQANIEFKAGNPPVDQIEKDIEKLVKEPEAGNWFHLLKNVDSGTLPGLFCKFQQVFQALGVIGNFQNMKPIVFCFCVLYRKWAILKVFTPEGSVVDYSKQFFDFDYVVSCGEIRVGNPRGWLEVIL